MADKIKELQKLMKDNHIHTYIITKFDPHQSEYSQAHWGSIEFISGFTGSAGTMVVTQNSAGLWTDGRYYLQAEKEIKNGEVVLHKLSEPATKSYLQFCIDETPIGGKIAFDGRTLAYEQVKQLIKKSSIKKFNIQNNIDLIGELWAERPKLSEEPIFDHLIKYCGKSRNDKIEEVRNIMKKENIEAYIICSLDDIAWLFNLRGADVEISPVFDAFSIITMNEALIFVHRCKTIDVIDILLKDNIILKDYNEIYNYIETLPKETVIGINFERINYSLYTKIKDFELVERGIDITSELKAIKNEVELQNLEKVNIRDGAAMVRIIKWLKENIDKQKISEFDLGIKINEIRSKGENYLKSSFNTIAAYMSNGAMLHYSAKKDDCSIIEPRGFLLIDSGASYLDGTTDITRTLVMGEIDDNLKKDFTLVLKGHIALFNCVFLYGTTGSNIDILARMPLWKNGIDYKSGTGHGLGFCLNVHEGPQKIARSANDYKLEVNMVTTNEPGVYRDGMYGIRTENTTVVKHRFTSESGKFLGLDVISYCPIDIDGIDLSLLEPEELDWINNYHKLVYNKLSNLLDDDEKAWLKKATREIGL